MIWKDPSRNIIYIILPKSVKALENLISILLKTVTIDFNTFFPKEKKLARIRMCVIICMDNIFLVHWKILF